MKALVLEDFNRLAVQEIPTPEPGPGEVLLRIAATGICGSDIHGYTGENGRRHPGQVMGHESVGVIAGVGEGVDDLTVGAPATFNPVVIPDSEVETFAGREQHSPNKKVIGVAPDLIASFAEYVLVPRRNVVVLPESMPITYGALIEPLAVAVHAVRRVTVTPGERALVLGGGPIGQSLVLALRMHGVEDILVSEVDPARRDLLASLGATVIDPTAGPVAEAVGELGGPVDVALDAVGITPTLADALTATVLGGRIALVGMGRPRVELDAYRVSTEERTIVGTFTYSARDFEDAARFVGSGEFDLAPLISREVAPDEADAAFAALAKGDGTAGKVLVRFDD